MSDMFLSADEISSMTERVQRAAQAKVLRSMGIEFRQRPDGSLAIARAHVEKMFGCAADKHKKTREFTPNWNSLNA
ncbi:MULTISPECIES: DUF4224 domain-containing protein [Massilia]|uniref:DUF4224 domain-containing protein n=1 Tax=Massilia haematophila TaxID=457923 RepID=A0ABV7PEX5_9BURK|nr:DUF4224 domain-containing protein [Massilia sp.]